MSYHLSAQHGASAGALGAYTSFNTGPVGKAIVARGGGTSSSDLKAYASAGAGAGGAALCTAYGGAAVAPLCAQAASAIASILVGHIGSPATAGNAYTLTDVWNATRKIAETAAEGAFKVRAYLAMRDQAIDDVAQGNATVRAWADQRLSALGIPAAPIRKEWAARQDLWEVYKATAIWALNPIGSPPGHNEAVANAYKNVDFETSGTPWGYGSPSVSAIAKQVGLRSEEVLTLLYYRTGPMAAPHEPINFGLVGAWEVLARKVSEQEVFDKKVRPPGVVLNTRLWITRTPPKVQISGMEYQFTNGLSPAQEATKLIFDLQEARAKLLKEASLNSMVKAAVSVIKIRQAEQAAARQRRNLLLLLGSAGVVGAGAWWYFKRRA